MTEQELKALLSAEQNAALGYLGGTISSERKKALEYYKGDPFGNEVEGRSKVVSTDVADTVEWILPALLKIFMSGDDVVTADPQEQEDEEVCKQINEYSNYVFTRENNGFIVLYSMFKDALLQKTGVSKVYWEPKDKFEQKQFIAIPPEQFMVDAVQYQQEGWELENHEMEPAPEGAQMVPGLEPMLHSGVWTKTTKKGSVCIVPVPPEEFLISRNAKDVASASYVAHRCRKTASELIEAGYPKKKVDQIPSEESDDQTMERSERFKGQDDDPYSDSTTNQAMRGIWVTEAYIKVDWDGDGIAEMRKVTHAGGGTVILDNEEWEGPRPFAAVTPIINTHRFYGMSIADVVMDLQLIKSTLLRQILDNLYLANNSQKVVNTDNVELDDLLTSRPGGIIRTKNGASPGDTVMPLVVENVASGSFPMLEYIDTIRENRTGVTRYNQGIDANSLNKTASGITQIMSAAQQRIDLIARIFAETGIKDIFRLIFWNLVRYPSEAKRTIRLRNKEWVEIDPATWGEDYDFVTNVGIGTGNKDQMLGHLMKILEMQVQALQMQGGPDGPLVTISNVYQTLSKMVENAGFKNVNDFFTEPPSAEEMAQQPQEPPPLSPEEQKLELEKQKMTMDLEHTKAKNEMELQQIQAKGAMTQEAAMTKMHQSSLAFAAKASGMSTKGIDPDADEAENASMTQLAQAIAQLAQSQAQGQQQLLSVFMQGQQQLIEAMTAPKVITSPDGRQYTSQTATVQ